jgi:hypothetical protein
MSSSVPDVFKPILIGAVGVLLAGYIGLTREARESMQAKVCDISGRVMNPLATSKANPFALRESPTGRTLSAMLSGSSDKSFHLGVSESGGAAAPTSFLTPSAGWLSRVDRGLKPALHMHASEAEDHDHCGDGCKDEAGHAMHMAGMAKHGRSNSDSATKEAYLLDPANFFALSTALFYIVEQGGGRAGVATGHARPQENLRNSRAPCLYSMPKFDTRSGWWPEQCLSAAKTLQALWSIDAMLGKTTSPDSQSNPALSNAVLSALASDIRGLMSLADAQRATLEEIGVWESRSPAQVKFYDELHREALGFLNAVEGRLRAGKLALPSNGVPQPR